MNQPHDPPEWLNSEPPPSPVQKKKRSKTWIWIIAVVVAFLLGIILGSVSTRDADKKDAAAASETRTTSSARQSETTTTTTTTSKSSPPTMTAVVTSPSSKPAVPGPPPPPNRGITGIGADLNAWNATHTENPYFHNGQVYGFDPSLPSYLSNHGAVYFNVQKVGWIDSYGLNMPSVTEDEAIARIRRELPDDATELWRLPLDTCHRFAFDSPNLDADLGPTVVTVQLQDVREDGSPAPDPQVFNQAQFDTSGTRQPNPDVGC